MFCCHYCGVCVKDGGLIVSSSRYIVGSLMFLTIIESDLIACTYSTTLWCTRNYLAFVRLEVLYQQMKLCQWIYWFCCGHKYQQIRLIAANRSLFANKKLPSSRLLISSDSIQNYFTNPVLINGSERWILNYKEEKVVITFLTKFWEILLAQKLKMEYGGLSTTRKSANNVKIRI